jgi:hypothetical protein
MNAAPLHNRPGILTDYSLHILKSNSLSNKFFLLGKSLDGAASGYGGCQVLVQWDT